MVYSGLVPFKGKNLTEAQAYKSIKLIESEIYDVVAKVANMVNKDKTIIHSFSVESLELPCMKMIRYVMEESLESLKYQVTVRYANDSDVIPITWYFDREN